MIAKSRESAITKNRTGSRKFHSENSPQHDLSIQGHLQNDLQRYTYLYKKRYCHTLCREALTDPQLPLSGFGLTDWLCSRANWTFMANAEFHDPMMSYGLAVGMMQKSDYFWIVAARCWEWLWEMQTVKARSSLHLKCTELTGRLAKMCLQNRKGLSYSQNVIFLYLQRSLANWKSEGS